MKAWNDFQVPAVIEARAGKTLGARSPQRCHVEQQVVARLLQHRVEALDGEAKNFGQVLQFIRRARNKFRMMALGKNRHFKREPARVGTKKNVAVIFRDQPRAVGALSM